MLMDQEVNRVYNELKEMQDRRGMRERAIDDISRFALDFFDISLQDMLDNNRLLNDEYSKQQEESVFFNITVEIWNAEDQEAVWGIDIPDHPYKDDIEAVRAFRYAKSLINDYMSGKEFETRTFETLIVTIQKVLTEIPDNCLERITVLECFMLCANQLKNYGIESKYWKKLAKKWKEVVASGLYPKNEAERVYLENNIFLLQPDYMKQLIRSR